MDGPTACDTYVHFIESGALSYSWYADVHTAGFESTWRVTFREYDGVTFTPLYALDHPTIMKAVRTLAVKWIMNKPSAREVHARVSGDAMRECLNFLADPENADFDADTADQVMQFAAFGKVVYA